MEKKATTTLKISYNEALEELQTILEELNAETLDIDHLSDKVKRANTLVAHCKGKILKTQKELDQIIAKE